MYNSQIAKNNKKLALNKDYIENKDGNVKILFLKSIEDIKNIQNKEKIYLEQMKLMCEHENIYLI